jgi:hypothetical protein
MKGSEIFNMTKKFRKFAQKLLEPLILEYRAEKSGIYIVNSFVNLQLRSNEAQASVLVFWMMG